ncbi:MAG: hypothetical protein SGI73_12860 [Chloroflexota bacterium]|nr:hypothetical protein [Chloroflexota bacterium]
MWKLRTVFVCYRQASSTSARRRDGRRRGRCVDTQSCADRAPGQTNGVGTDEAWALAAS